MLLQTRGDYSEKLACCMSRFLSAVFSTIKHIHFRADFRQMMPRVPSVFEVMQHETVASYDWLLHLKRVLRWKDGRIRGIARLAAISIS